MATVVNLLSLFVALHSLQLLTDYYVRQSAEHISLHTQCHSELSSVWHYTGPPVQTIARISRVYGVFGILGYSLSCHASILLPLTNTELLLYDSVLVTP